MLTPNKEAPVAIEVFDAATVAGELESLVPDYAGNERELRLAVSRRLKAALLQGRAAAERLLIKERAGRRCARRPCWMQDEILRVLYEFVAKHLYPAQNPSEAERMAIIGTGGYGRGYWPRGRTSISCSCFHTNRRPGANRSPS